MGLYDQAVASNQNIWQQKLQQPTAVGRFMESLRRGQEGLAQRKSQEQQLQAKMQAEEADRQLKMQEAQRKAESDKVNKVRIFTNVMSNAGDPDKAAKFLSTISPESNADWMELAQSYKAQNGMGLGGARQAATTGMMEEQARGNRINNDINDEYGGPLREAQIANWKARTDRLGQMPVGGTGVGQRGRWVQVATEPGQPRKMMNSLTGEVMDMEQGGSPVPTPRKEVPPNQRKAMIDTNTQVAEIDNAIKMVSTKQSAFGAKNYIPDEAMQRMDPSGVAARAAVAKVSALKVHDLTGSAQTVAEVERLKPFLPRVTDTPQVIKTKLENLKREMVMMEKEYQAAFPEERFVGAPGSSPSGSPSVDDLKNAFNIR